VAALGGAKLVRLGEYADVCCGHRGTARTHHHPILEAGIMACHGSFESGFTPRNSSSGSFLASWIVSESD